MCSLIHPRPSHRSKLSSPDGTACRISLAISRGWPELAAGVLHQPIPDRRFGQDVLRLRRVVLELLPQVTHINAYVVTILGMRRSPHFAQNLPMREHLARVCNQQTE